MGTRVIQGSSGKRIQITGVPSTDLTTEEELGEVHVPKVMGPVGSSLTLEGQLAQYGQGASAIKEGALRGETRFTRWTGRLLVLTVVAPVVFLLIGFVMLAIWSVVDTWF
jgi:hypothetical protein